MRSQWRWVAGVVALMLSACAEGPTGMAREARVVMSFLTPATVRTVVVEVSGPGLSPAVVLNIPVAADSTARDTLMLTAGAGRRFVVTALDSAGVTTHRADTTITLQAGANAPLAMRLEPLPSTLGITVTFGGASVTVPDTSTRVMVSGESIRIAATGRNASSDSIPSDALVWGSLNPAVATAIDGLVVADRPGVTTVAVSYLGAAVRIPVKVVDVLLEGGTNLPTGTDVSVSGRLEGDSAGVRSGKLFFQYAYSGVQPVIFAAYFSASDASWEDWTAGENILSHVTLTGNQWSNTIRINRAAGIAPTDIVIDVVGNEGAGEYVYPWYGVSLRIRARAP